MENDDYQHVLSIVTHRLLRKKDKNDGILPEGEIKKTLDRELSNDDYEIDQSKILAELESNFSTLIGDTTSLHSKDDHPEAPWVTERLKDDSLSWAFWFRYRDYLLKNGMPEPVVTRMDQITSSILDSLMPPDTDKAWDQRGLVVGHVQSGKTANYTGLICKAVDAGYEVIIVLAGAHNNLRTQTQIRLEEGFLGYKTIDQDVKKRETTGVGKIHIKTVLANTLTTRHEDGDFKTTIAKHSGINPGGNPLLFVVKKNTTVLKNLLNWVESVAHSQNFTHGKIPRIPLLMIDDEADYASVDTKKQDEESDIEHDPTKINGLIRKILKAFEQSVYIGYTATPFANIFIPETAQTDAHDNDLFPRTFIFSLPAPSNYVGPAKIFGLEDDQDELPIFRTIDDHAESLASDEKNGWVPPRHKKDHRPLYFGNNDLPPSLRKAIRSFIIATTVRKARGQTNSHNSMLIHVTRFVDVQSKVREQVEHEFHQLSNRIIYGDGDRKPSAMDELKEIWHTDFIPTYEKINEPDCTELSWNQVKPFIKEAVLSICVKEINGSSEDILEYSRKTAQKKPFDVIAVGGDKLSRGLTLEGLTVSYFLRPSKMYDTLMQMGRWFGYRPGYLDVCRIYTTANLQQWFRHISIASEELREDFKKMALSGCTPVEYGHRVLSHPEMLITSATKMRHTEKRLTSFEGCPAETTVFLQKPEILENNFNAFRKLIRNLEDDTNNHSECYREDAENKLVWKKVSPERIINFLTEYRGHSAARAHPVYLTDYIKNQVKREKLVNWTVYLCQGSGDKIRVTADCEIKRVLRSRLTLETDTNTTESPYKVRRVGNPTDEFIDLNPKEKQKALEITLKTWEIDGKVKKRPEAPTGPGIRETRPPERGLICIYPVETSDHPDKSVTLIGFLISFPGDKSATPCEYRVNDVYKRLEEEGLWDEECID